jgi:receptor-interacting serine/threonine-protein kinase 5
MKRKFRLLELKFNSILLMLHEKNIQKFILRVYDMARDLLITPRKIEYAKEKELKLYEALTELTILKQDEFKQLIGETVVSTRPLILNSVIDYEFHHVEFVESDRVTSQSPTSSSSSLNSDSLDLLGTSASPTNNGKSGNYREGTRRV